MANEIVWYDDTETGAPVLNNAAGSLIALLDALLVTGFNPQTLTSITVTSGVATATKVGHGYSSLRMVDIAGAGTALINGRKLVTLTSSSTFTFPAPGVADGTITGVITAKRSPLGWARAHAAGATVGMYSRTDVTATAMSMRVDDSASGINARAIMVESFTDINTYVGSAPTSTQLSGGQYWVKGAASTSAKPWVLVGDSRTFWLFMDSSGYPAASYGGSLAGPYVFGDILSYRAADAYGCILGGAGSAGADPSGIGYSATALGTAPSSPASLIARAPNGIGVAVGVVNLASHRIGGSPGPAYPSTVDNGMVLSTPVFLLDGSSGGPIRGEARGLADPLCAIAQGLLHKQVLSNLTGSSRSVLAIATMAYGQAGHMMFDITGPWA